MKFVYLFSRYLLFDVLKWCLLFLLAMFFGVRVDVPWYSILIYFLSTSVVSFAILGLHMLLSLRWSNQVISLSVAILGSLSNIILMFVSQTAMYFSPYAWYGLLLPLDFKVAGHQFIQVLRELTYYPLIAGLFVGVAFYQLAKRMKVGN